MPLSIPSCQYKVDYTPRSVSRLLHGSVNNGSLKIGILLPVDILLLREALLHFSFCNFSFCSCQNNSLVIQNYEDVTHTLFNCSETSCSVTHKILYGKHTSDQVPPRNSWMVLPCNRSSSGAACCSP